MCSDDDKGIWRMFSSLGGWCFSYRPPQSIYYSDATHFHHNGRTSWFSVMGKGQPRLFHYIFSSTKYWILFFFLFSIHDFAKCVLSDVIWFPWNIGTLETKNMKIFSCCSFYGIQNRSFGMFCVGRTGAQWQTPKNIYSAFIRWSIISYRALHETPSLSKCLEM